MPGWRASTDGSRPIPSNEPSPDAAPAVVPAREFALDVYRVTAIVLVVFGHWLAAVLTYRNGQFGRQNALVELPWTQWLTWAFQVVPVFFVVAGYASALSWRRWQQSARGPRQRWLRQRLARVAGPTSAYVAVVVSVVAILSIVGVDASALAFGGWAVGMHLWFLAVYLGVVALTPALVAADRRWGLAVPVALAIAAATVDALSIGGEIPYVEWLNYLFCWVAIYQLGIAWHTGRLRGIRPVLLAVAAAIALAALVSWGPYPISMIDVPGAAVHNVEPPSLALLAFGAAQAGVVLLAAPLVNRVLGSPRWRRPLAVANQNVMMLYLWHMVPVIIVALVGYPGGLLPQPPIGSGAWWLARLQWLAILSLLTAVELALLWWQRARFAAPLPIVGTPLRPSWTEPLLLIGATAVAVALAGFAARGFAPGGSLPAIALLLFAAGAVLTAIGPREAAIR